MEGAFLGFESPDSARRGKRRQHGYTLVNPFSVKRKEAAEVGSEEPEVSFKTLTEDKEANAMEEGEILDEVPDDLSQETALENPLQKDSSLGLCLEDLVAKASPPVNIPVPEVSFKTLTEDKEANAMEEGEILDEVPDELSQETAVENPLQKDSSLDLCLEDLVAKANPPVNIPVAEVNQSKDLATPVVTEQQQMEHVNQFSFPMIGNISNYIMKRKVGEGAYGEVYMGSHKQTGKVVAVKKLKCEHGDNGFPKNSLREIQILRQVQHKNVVQYIEICNSNDPNSCVYFVVMEYCEYGFSEVNLAGVSASIEEKKLVVHQLLDGVQYLHKNNILHRDLKPANLLFTSKGLLKIVDFGMARHVHGPPEKLEKTYTNYVVTLWYRSPELLLGATEYGFAIDMWAVGCIVGELFMGAVMLPGGTEQKQLVLIQQLCGPICPEKWPGFLKLPLHNSIHWNLKCERRIMSHLSRYVPHPEVVDLVDKLLVYNPEERLTATLALQHKAFEAKPEPACTLETLMFKIKRAKIKQSQQETQRRLTEETSFSSRIY